MEKVALITLGCKTNQYESQALGELLEKEGYEVAYKMCKADIYVLNTCAVTNEAERKSRQFVGKLRKLNPKCKIFVCGCASQNNPEQFKALEGVQYVIGNANRLSLLEKITARKGGKVQKLPDAYEDLRITKPKNSRTYIKIQDGCNRFCSYCLIPHLRGRSRSRSILDIMQEVDTLAKAGAKEIVLTGIDISDYRIDDQPALLELLKQIDVFGVRIRLGSIEPNMLTDDFVVGLSQIHNICPHFHISMQSGCTETLKRMNRHYSAEFFLQRVKMLRTIFKNCAITTDMIVGFPSETDKEFKATLATIKKAKFAEMHIFPYSRRGGTTADKLLGVKNNGFDLVDPQVVKARMKIAMDIAEKMKIQYLRAQRGNVLSAVLEEQSGKYITGTTENYVKVYIPNACKTLLGTLQKVKIGKRFQDGVLAEISE